MNFNFIVVCIETFHQFLYFRKTPRGINQLHKHKNMFLSERFQTHIARCAALEMIIRLANLQFVNLKFFIGKLTKITSISSSETEENFSF